MSCQFCQYTWTPRVANPKACPDCKRRSPIGKIEPVQDRLYAHTSKGSVRSESNESSTPTDDLEGLLESGQGYIEPERTIVPFEES